MIVLRGACRRPVRAERGAALVEVIVGVVILAVVGTMAVSTTVGGVGLLMRGVAQSREANVLLRALETARSGQSVPLSLEGFSLSSTSRDVAPFQDAWILSWGANASCQGSCEVPFNTIGSLRRVEVVISGGSQDAAGLRGMTFTAPLAFFPTPTPTRTPTPTPTPTPDPPCVGGC